MSLHYPVKYLLPFWLVVAISLVFLCHRVYYTCTKHSCIEIVWCGQLLVLSANTVRLRCELVIAVQCHNHDQGRLTFIYLFGGRVFGWRQRGPKGRGGVGFWSQGAPSPVAMGLRECCKLPQCGLRQIPGEIDLGTFSTIWKPSPVLGHSWFRSRASSGDQEC